MPEPELWVVVCSDLHLAVGPFIGLVDAQAAAEQITEKSEYCKFYPVKFQSTMEVETESPKTFRTGQYL